MITRDELRQFGLRAIEQAAAEREQQLFANFEQRARTYERLADAADAVEAMLARDEAYSIWGPPGDNER